MCVNCFGPSRRGVMAGMMAAAVAACSENPASGRNQFAFVPDEALVQMADQAWAQLLAEAPVARDPALHARLARIGAPLVEATGRHDLAWEFVAFDAPDLNAFVLPNGKVGFFRGMMDFADDDEELGSVIAHEAAHILARHPAERVSQQLAVQAGISLAQALLWGESGENARLVAGALGAGAVYGVLLPFSRAHELEADRIGVGLMRQVGMDAHAAVRFWEKMAARQSRAGAEIEALSTHPADGRRLAELRAAVGMV